MAHPDLERSGPQFVRGWIEDAGDLDVVARLDACGRDAELLSSGVA